MKKLPIKLGKEPLIDAVFEIRFISAFSVSGILPGLLFGRLDGDKTIEQLSIAQIPVHIREIDSNLKYAPICRLSWDKYYINIGDHSVSIGIKHPYPGWENFKDSITKVMEILNGTHIINSVERYAIKYINLLQAESHQGQLNYVDLDLSLAGHKLNEGAFQLRIEVPRDQYIHVVQLVSSATVTLPSGETKSGLIIDVDTVSKQTNFSFDILFNNLSDELDEIHQFNKDMFFDCLKQQTIDDLEPIYD